MSEKCRQHEADPQGSDSCEYCAMKRESAEWMREASSPEYFERFKAVLTGENKRMSAAEFARMAGCVPSNVSHLLKYGVGTKGGIVPKHMWRAAKSLGISK